MQTNQDIGIVIPTKNEEADLPRLLESIVSQGHPVDRIVVVDNFSTDRTLALAASFGVRTIEAGPNQSTQRNIGARALSSGTIFFVDADMELEQGLLDEIASLMYGGAECIVVPETTQAEDWLGEARALERSLFYGDATIESARVFSRRVFDACGGYDEKITGGEDWLLSRRACDLSEVSRTQRQINHFEGKLSIGGLLWKYLHYGRGYYGLYRAGTQAFIAHTNPIRPSIVAHWKKLAENPRGTAMLLIYKFITYTAGLVGFAMAAFDDARRR